MNIFEEFYEIKKKGENTNIWFNLELLKALREISNQLKELNKIAMVS